jgi:DNA-binding transcriptional ArsR family regulator
MANDPFVALAHPVRRGIVERLARESTTVGAATEQFGLAKPTVSRHLKVLEDAGMVRRRVVGRCHYLELNAASLEAPYAWLSDQRSAWERLFDAVEDHLRDQLSDDD